MNIEDKFQQAYQKLKENIEKRSMNKLYTALGYTSNLDLICDFRIDILNRLLAEHMQGKRLDEMQVAPMIHTVEELLETMVYYCMHGIGGEADVEDAELVKSCFPYKNGMGGTAVQAALALAQLGGESLVHLTDNSKEVCDILVSPYIHVALEDGSTGCTDRVEQTNPQEVHIIIQYKKGDVIRLGDQSVTIPCSNRLILTKNTVNTYVPFWEPYFKWVENHAEQVSSNVLSSFNCILDPVILRERLEYVKNHVSVYRQNNPDGMVYFEDAHYHNEYVRELCAEILYPYVDILSMNEEELEYTLETMYNVKVDIDNIYSCVEGIDFLQKKFNFSKGIIVHTKDYAMFVGDPGRFDIESGLMFGAMLATAKAANGVYGTPQMIEGILKLDMSDKGLYNLRLLEESPYKDRAILVPTRYIDKPKYTIGLGDSFTGGFQMCFN